MPTCLRAEQLRQQEAGGSGPALLPAPPPWRDPVNTTASFVELWAPSWVNPWAKGQGWGLEVGALHLLGTDPSALKLEKSLIQGQTNGH